MKRVKTEENLDAIRRIAKISMFQSQRLDGFCFEIRCM